MRNRLAVVLVVVALAGCAFASRSWNGCAYFEGDPEAAWPGWDSEPVCKSLLEAQHEGRR